jgi:hypothetical protein
MLGNKSVKDFVDRQINPSKWHIAIVITVVLFMYVIGLFNFVVQSERARWILILATSVLWIGLVTVESDTLIRLVREGFTPKLSKKFLDSLIYFAIIWLVFEKMRIPFLVIPILSGLLIGVTIYFSVMLWKYSKLAHVIIEFLDLYTPGLGIRLFSILTGLRFIAYNHSENVFWGLLALGHIAFMLTLLYTAENIRRLLRMK